MNSLVADFRRSNPTDQRSDDQLTLTLGAKYPQLLERYPDARPDYDRLTGATAIISGAEPDSALMSGLKAASTEIFPAFGTAAGAAVAGALASETGPGAVPAAIAGGIAGGKLFRGIQNKVIEAFGGDPESIAAQEQANAQAHPVASGMGAFLGQAPAMMGPGVAKVGEKVAESLATRGVSKAIAAKVGAVAENAAAGALLSGSSAAQQPDATVGGVAGQMIQGAVTMGPLGFIPAAKSVFGAIGWKAPTDAAVMGLNNALYNHFVNGQPIDPKAIAEQAGVDVPGFMLMNGLMAAFHGMPWMPTRDGKLVAKPEEMAKGQGQMAQPEPTVANPATVQEGINPADTYQMAPETKANITQVVQRELGGETGLPMETALAAIYSDPNLHAFYTLEKQRLVAEAPPPAPAPEPEPAPVPVTADETAPPAAALPLATSVEPESRVTTAADAAQARLGAARRAAQATDLQDLDDAVRTAGARIVARNLEQRQAQLDEARRQAAQQEAERIAYLDEHPEVDQNAVDENELADAAEAHLAQNTPKPPTPAPVAALSPQATPAAEPAWKRLAAPAEEVLDRVGFGTAQVTGQKAEVKAGKVGVGQKAAEAFTETDSAEQLYTDVSADKDDRKLSRKLGVFESPDGSHVLVGTAYENGGKRYVTAFDDQGKPKAMQFDKLKDQGYKLVASLKTKDPARDYAVTYSREDWGKMADDLRTQRNAARATAGAMEEHLQQSKDVGRENPEESAEPTGPEPEPEQTAETAAPVPEIKGFTADHARAIYDAVQGLKGLEGEALDRAFTEALGKSKRAMAAVRQALKALGKAGVAPDVAFDGLRSSIYESLRTSGGSKAAFADSLLSGKGARANEAARVGADTGPGKAGATSAGGSQGVEAGADANAKVAAAASATDVAPTEAQKAAGNYAKGHVTIDGLDISIENPKGSVRSGVGPDGKPWEVTIPAHYGYVRGTEGKDGDHVDVYIGPHPESQKVWVVDQIDPTTKKFDEHKAMLGYNSQQEALADYLKAFSDNSGANRIGEMTFMPRDEFADWVNEADTTKPLAYGKEFKPSSLVRYRAEQEARTERANRTEREVATAFHSAVEGLRISGVDVRVLGSRLARLEARYQGAGRTITMSVADLHNPTADNLTSLFHEGFHDVFNRETPERQEMGRKAMDGVSLDDFRVKLEPGVDPAKVVPEEHLAEFMARRLVEQGFNPAEARGFGQAAVRWVKDIYTRAVMAVQESLGFEVSRERAQEYFENRLKQALAGDAQYSFVSWIGGPKLRQEDVLSPSDMALVRYRELGHVSDEETEVSRDQNATALVERDVAAQNAVEGALRKQYDAWNTLGHNPSGLSFEDFVRSGNFVKLDRLPEEVVAERNKTLAAAGHAGVNPKLDLAGVKNESMRQRAAAVGLRRLQDMWREMTSRRNEAEWSLSTKNRSNLIDRLARVSTERHQLYTDYTNAEMLFAQAKQQVEGLFKQLRDSAKDASGGARKLGTLEQVIRDLDGKIDQPLLTQYAKVIDRLHVQLTRDSAVQRKFTDILDRVAALSIKWSDPARDIRDQIKMAAAAGDTLLQGLVAPVPDARGLMATVIAFGKSNSHVMDLLQLRRSDALSERTVVNQAFHKALTENRDALKDAREMVRKLPRLGKIADRLLDKLEATTKEQQELLDEVHRNRTFIDFHQDTGPLLRQEMAKLEHTIGAVNEEWEPTNGAEYLVPPRPNSNLLQVEASKKTFRLTANGFNTADVRADMKRMADWMEGVPVDQRGATWATVKRQYDKLAWTDLNSAHLGIQNNWVVRLLAPLPDRLQALGTPAGREAAKRIRQMVFWTSSFRSKVEELGRKWEEAEGDAMKAVGIQRPDVFRELFHSGAMGLIEKRQDLLAANKDVATAEAQALAELQRHYASNPDTAALVSKPGAWKALEKYYRQSAANASWQDQVRKDVGNKVQDGNGYRETIGATPFTVPRMVSRVAERVFKAMQPGWSGDKLDARKNAAAYQADPTAFRKAMQARFTPEVWERFVRPIAERTGRSSFYAPVGPDGIHVMALRERVMKAYEQAKGDVVAFAENLYKLEGGRGDVGEFVGETLDTFQSFYSSMEKAFAQHEEANRLGMDAPRRFLMDARVSEEYPTEWLDYAPFDVHSMRQMMKLQVYHSSFGRNMEGITADFGTALKEQQGLADKLTELERMHPDKSGRRLREAVKADALAQGLNYTALSEARNNIRMTQGCQKRFEAMLTMEKDRPMEIQPVSELVGALTGLSVSGPATAFTDTVSLFEQPFRKFGLNPEAVRMSARSAKDAAGIAFQSALNAIGVKAFYDAEHVRLANELGYFDDDAVLSLKTKLKTAFSEASAASGVAGKGAAFVSRAVRTALGTGVGKAKVGEPIVPTLKASAFTWQSQCIHLSQILSWWKHYEGVTAKAVRHLEANPALLDDPKFEFAAKDLGVKEGRAWDYTRASLAEYGLSLEQMAREAVGRRKANPTAPLLTREQYRALAMQGQNAVTLESNLVTRTPRLMTDPIMNLANPLLGWALEKSYDAWKGFRAPNGQRSLSAFKTGLLAYAAILPATLAYAYMRDEYDEHIIGKKQNVLHLTTDNPFLAVLDNAARVGTFGIFGELPNQLFNYSTQRDLSIDQRVFLVNSLLNTKNALATWVRQGTADYQTVWRPLMQALGGSGYLQYVDVIDNALSLDNQEARVVKRIGVNNYLRVIGRELNMDVRTAQGMGAVPNSIGPYIGQMVLAAYANNPQDFREAYRNAVAEARADKKPDPEDYVKRTFAARNPLKVVFRTEPSEQEYRRILGALTDDGKVAVSTALRLYNGYAAQIGLKEDFGRAGRSQTDLTKLADLTPRGSISLDDVRKRAGY